MTSPDFHRLAAEGVEAVLDLRAGHVRRFAVNRDGRTIEPLHTAAWVDDPSITGDETLLANLRYLSGDFFCAPFGASDIDGGFSHGWPANSPWQLAGVEPHPAGGSVARYALEHEVFGARLVKEFTLRDGHPFLYERHIFHGGVGALPVANHGMTRFDRPGRLSFSPKLFGMTPDFVPEPNPARGRSALAYPSRFTAFDQVPTADGGVADITRYPFASRNEDLILLVERPDNPLGWAAAVRPDKRDIFLSLKLPSDYPTTMLWVSNGGRDYAPWNGRHVGVQGIEEGRIFGTAGHKAAIAPNELSDAGIPTSLTLDPDGSVEVRNVLAGLPLGDSWTEVVAVEAGDGTLTVRDAGGGELTVPYDDGFLHRR